MTSIRDRLALLAWLNAQRYREVFLVQDDTK
jgi:hypothetical protein